MDDDGARRGKWIWIAAGVAVVLLGVGLVMRFELLPSPVVADGPIRTVSFADGGKLEIIGISAGERVVNVVPKKWFSVPFLSNKGSNGSRWGGLNVDTEEENGEILRCRLHSDTPGAMLMEFRMKERDGRGMKLPSYLERSGFIFQDDRIGSKHAAHHQFSPTDDRVEALVAEMAKADLQVLIQHRDPQAGWIHLNGPWMFHEPWPDRYIVALNAWQRSLPDLEFRAIRADGQVVEFSLPNPDFRKLPSPGTAASLPLAHNGGDYTLTVNRVEKFGTSGDHPFASVEMDFQPRGRTVAGEYGAAATLRGGTAEDEWGNRVTFEQKSIRKVSRFGAFLPAASKRMTVRLTVVRTENCPRYDYTGYILMEGVVAADGLSVEFTPGPDAALLGVGTMPVGTIKRNPSGWGDAATKDWKFLTFHLAGDGGKVAAIENRIGDISPAQFLVFPEGSHESAGITPWCLSRSNRQSGGTFHFKREVTWSGSPEMLRPGAKIRVGVFRPAKNDDLTFDLALPEPVQPR